jgi:hypothetical protein
MNEEDPDSFTLLHTPDAKPPKWERPPDQVLFECAGCGARLERDIDLSNDAPLDLAVSWCNVPEAKAYRTRDWPLDPNDSTLLTIGGKRYCPGCAVSCDECGKPIFSSSQSATGQVLYGDTYDEGASFPDPRTCRPSNLCVDCLEAIPTCSYCGEPLSDDMETDEDGACCRTDGNSDSTQEGDECRRHQTA